MSSSYFQCLLFFFVFSIYFIILSFVAFHAICDISTFCPEVNWRDGGKWYITFMITVCFCTVFVWWHYVTWVYSPEVWICSACCIIHSLDYMVIPLLLYITQLTLGSWCLCNVFEDGVLHLQSWPTTLNN